MNDEMINRIARVCHEANRAYCAAMGDHSQLPWDEAPQWQRDSVILGVKNVVANPGCLPGASHASWLEQKKREGWKHGPVKDVEKKEHPCYVPYEDLPQEQKAKDYIFLAIAKTMLAGG